MNKILITNYNDEILTAEYDGSRILDINIESTSMYHVGDIFVGRVESIAKNIGAAFIEISPGQNCFYQLKRQDNLKVGDEILIQISKEAVKTKDPECDIKISLPGKYIVVNEGRYRLGISSKIPNNDNKFALQQLFDATFSYDDNYSFIVRTNAETLSPEEVLREASESITKISEIREKASHSVVYKKIYSGNQYYLDKIRDARGEVEIITDIQDVIEDVRLQYPDVCATFYDDKDLSITALYKIESAISEATNKKVWLKSGGYLVIEETEALTVIDVNTGKNDSGKNIQNTFFETNLEAAIEASRQLRLRNISGIIIIDFIDMNDRSRMDEVIWNLKEALLSDPIKATYVDTTKLNLVEITRKKMLKSLKEQLVTK